MCKESIKYCKWGRTIKIRIIYFYFLLIVVLLITSSCRNISESEYRVNKNIYASEEYLNLLSKFPKDKQGNSLEPVLEPKGPSDQPMTYGLVLSSESLHYKAKQNNESSERVKNAVKWIVENSDLNEDGNLGWGLPQAWDAFSDGTTNPENHPYTITTAIVLEGLLDAISIEDFWSEAEEREIKQLISDVILYWLNNVYISDGKIGFLGYSEEPTDMINTPNVSGMFLSSIVRALEEHDDIFIDSEETFVVEKAHEITNMLVKTVKLENDVPYWDYYYDIIDTNNKSRGNDLVHHVYILWGLEEYRKHFDEIEIPFDFDASLKSLDSFWKDEKIQHFPQNNVQSIPNQNPANLWGVGMMVAFYAKYDEKDMANKAIEVISRDYGPIPELKMRPEYFSSDDNNFYERYAAHVLFGLSYRDFYQD